MDIYQMTYQLKVRYTMSSGVLLDSASSLAMAVRHSTVDLIGPSRAGVCVVDQYACDYLMISHTPLLHECLCVVIVTVQGETDSPEFLGGILASDTFVKVSLGDGCGLLMLKARVVDRLWVGAQRCS